MTVTSYRIGNCYWKCLKPFFAGNQTMSHRNFWVVVIKKFLANLALHSTIIRVFFCGFILNHFLFWFCFSQVCLVLASLFAVIVYRVVSREDYFKNSGPAGSLLSSVTSTFLNTLSIMIMQKVCWYKTMF